MAEPEKSPLESIFAAQRFAALSEPAPANFGLDFMRISFFNPSRVNAARNRPGEDFEVLGAKTTPKVLAGEVFALLGVSVDSFSRLYLRQQAMALTSAAKRGEEATVQQLVASNVPRNALVRRGFDGLDEFLDDMFGVMYSHIGRQANTFGNFVVAQAVADVELHPDIVLDLRDPKPSNTLS